MMIYKEKIFFYKTDSWLDKKKLWCPKVKQNLEDIFTWKRFCMQQQYLKNLIFSVQLQKIS